MYSIYTFTISLTNNNFNILITYVYNICVKLATDNTTTAGNNYKELYDCKWDPMTLFNITLPTPAFKFL